jgi:ribonuclease HII
MHLALDKLLIRPGHILIDGNRFHPYSDIPHTCVVKGDGIYASIAAASILAKTWRDEYMVSLHRDWPQYGWEENKGYPTPRHRAAIREYGFSPFHRKSFSFLYE